MTHQQVADYEIAPDLFPDTLPVEPLSEDHRSDPLAARTTNAGAPRLSDIELVALFLELPPAMALKRAHDALLDNGGLRRLLDLPPSTLRQLPGFTHRAISQLKASVELGRRHLVRRLERSSPMTDPATIFAYFMAKLRHHDVEVFAVLFLDSRNRAIAYEEITRGTVDGAVVHPREIVRLALIHNAKSIVVSHNHPSGDPSPSLADIQLTKQIAAALYPVEVTLLDHIIVGDGEAVSFSARGLIR